jgi:hypothetical protein
MAHDVFISYSVKDGQVAGQVCRALEEQEIKCWMAPRDVPFGADYEETIVDAITASPLLVLILSSHSNASQHVKREIQNACAEGSPTEIIPLRIDAVAYSKALRYYLGSAQWLDASTPPLEAHLRRLVEHVRTRLRRSDKETTTPVLTLPEPTPPEPIRPVVPVRPHDPAVDYEPPPTPMTGGGRSFNNMWLAAGAGGLLLLAAVVVAAYLLSGDGGSGNVNAANGNSFNVDSNNVANNNVVNNNLANLNANVALTPTPAFTPTRTPTPTPMATPAQTPTLTPTPAPTPTPYDLVNDSLIASSIRMRFINYPGLSKVYVESVKRGSVTLGGEVYSPRCREAAEKLSYVNRLVVGVTNNIRVVFLPKEQFLQKLVNCGTS